MEYAHLPCREDGPNHIALPLIIHPPHHTRRWCRLEIGSDGIVPVRCVCTDGTRVCLPLKRQQKLEEIFERIPEFARKVRPPRLFQSQMTTGLHSTWFWTRPSMRGAGPHADAAADRAGEWPGCSGVGAEGSSGGNDERRHQGRGCPCRSGLSKEPSGAQSAVPESTKQTSHIQNPQPQTL